jgi:serine/threonine protein kinase
MGGKPSSHESLEKESFEKKHEREIDDACTFKAGQDNFPFSKSPKWEKNIHGFRPQSGTFGTVTPVCRESDPQDCGYVQKNSSLKDSLAEINAYGHLKNLGLNKDPHPVVANVFDYGELPHKCSGYIITEKMDMELEDYIFFVIRAEKLEHTQKISLVSTVIERALFLLDRLHQEGFLCHNDPHLGNFMMRDRNAKECSESLCFPEDTRFLKTLSMEGSDYEQFLMAATHSKLTLIDFGLSRPILYEVEARRSDMIPEVDYYLFLLDILKMGFSDYVIPELQTRIAARMTKDDLKRVLENTQRGYEESYIKFEESELRRTVAQEYYMPNDTQWVFPEVEGHEPFTLELLDFEKTEEELVQDVEKAQNANTKFLACYELAKFRFIQLFSSETGGKIDIENVRLALYYLKNADLDTFDSHEFDEYDISTLHAMEDILGVFLRERAVEQIKHLVARMDVHPLSAMKSQAQKNLALWGIEEERPVSHFQRRKDAAVEFERGEKQWQSVAKKELSSKAPSSKKELSKKELSKKAPKLNLISKRKKTPFFSEKDEHVKIRMRLGNPGQKIAARRKFLKAVKTSEDPDMIFSDIRAVLSEYVVEKGIKENMFEPEVKFLQKDKEYFVLEVKPLVSQKELTQFFEREFTENGPSTWMRTDPVFLNLEEFFQDVLGFDAVF